MLLGLSLCLGDFWSEGKQHAEGLGFCRIQRLGS